MRMLETCTHSASRCISIHIGYLLVLVLFTITKYVCVCVCVCVRACVCVMCMHVCLGTVQFLHFSLQAYIGSHVESNSVVIKYSHGQQRCGCQIFWHLLGAVYAPPLSYRYPSSKLQEPRQQLRWHWPRPDRRDTGDYTAWRTW